MSLYHIDFTTGQLVPVVNADRFAVGQILTYEDMANPCKRYAVTSENPGTYGQPLICEDGHATNCAPSSIGRGGWRDTGDTLTAAELVQFIEAAKARQAREQIAAKAAAEAASNDRAARRAQHLAEHPELKAIQPGEYASAKAGAANIRIQLKRAFPGIKFSVTSEVYSGGDAINIKWAMGPTGREVEAITARYQEGSFNGMEDIYENNRENVWPELFGGAKYVSENREDGDAFTTIAGHLCDLFGIERPAKNQYWTLNGLDDDKVNQTTRGLLAATSFPPGAMITGVEHMPEGEENEAVPTWTRSGFARYYRVLYSVPGSQSAAVPPIAAPAATEPSAATAAAQIRENVERNGIELHFAAKPPAFLLESLKALGWRWTRAGGCWYHKATEDARQFAARILANLPA